MTTVELRSEIVQMIKSERDTSILEAIRTLLYKLREAGGEDLSDADIEAFDRHHAAYVRGDLKGITGKESVKRLRKVKAG